MRQGTDAVLGKKIVILVSEIMVVGRLFCSVGVHFVLLWPLSTIRSGRGAAMGYHFRRIASDEPRLHSLL